nr:hypothetical protein [Tanacetum cinerariifolium]
MLLKQSDLMVLEKKVNIKPINYTELNRLLDDFGKHFVPQQELSDEQAFRLQTSHHNTDQYVSLHVKIEAPWELHKKQFLIENDRLLDQIISQDIMNIVVNSSLDINTSVNVNSSAAMSDYVNYVEMSNKCLKLEAESLFNQLLKKSVEIIDFNAQLQEKVVVITLLKNDLRKFKGKDIVDNAAQVSNATTIAPRMYKIDPVTLAPKNKNNRETHIYYLKHTMEQAAILREIVKQAKSLNHLDNASYSTCKYVKLIQ